MRKPDGKIVLLGDVNVGKTSLLQRYMERRFPDTVSTVGGAFYLKQWRSCHLSLWDTAGREQFHGLGSMYCRGAAAVILTYDVNQWQSLRELEDRFLGLTDTASADCLFAIVGNKVDLSAPGRGARQVRPEDAVALYRKVLRHRLLDERAAPAAERMCFETSAKTGHNVDLLFETLFDLVEPVVQRHRAERPPPQTVELDSRPPPARPRPGCCA